MKIVTAGCLQEDLMDEFKASILPHLQAKICYALCSILLIFIRSLFFNLFMHAAPAGRIEGDDVPARPRLGNLLRIGLLLWTTISVAQEQSADPARTSDLSELSLKELMDLEVFTAASLLPTEYTRAPGTVYSFDRQDFVRLGVRRLDDLLAYVPGFQLSQHRKRHRSIWARGLLDVYNDKLLLLVDGVRRQHVYYGHFSLGDNFPLEKIEKVEIILGPASSLYGANAFGGIISVTTRNFSKRTTLTATVEGGNHERIKGTVLANSERLQLFGSYLNQDAPFREDRKSFIGGTTAQPRDEDFANLFLKFSPMDGLTISADYYRENTPFLFIPDTQDAFIRGEFLNLTGSYEAGDLDRGLIRANLYYTRDYAREFELEQVSQSLGYEENQNAFIVGSMVTGFKRLFDDHVFGLGLRWEHTEADNFDFERRFHFSRGFLNPPETGSLLSNPNIANDDYAVFLQHVWNIHPQLELTLGGRYDHFEQFGGFFNYRAALVYMPDDHQTLKALYGTAIRTPTFREYLKVLEGTSFVPPIPDPERIRSVEFGYLYRWENANLSITLFQNEVDDYIHVIPTPDGSDEYFTNSTDTWCLRGVETLLQFRPIDGLDLRLSAAYLDAVQHNVGRLPYLAPWTGSFNLNYNFIGNHHLGLSLFYSSGRTDTNGFRDDNPQDFLIANLFGSGPIIHSLSYRWGIDNVFDTRVFDPAGDFGNQHNTERGAREFWLRVKWKFEF